MNSPAIILASTSIYRSALLARLRIPFTIVAPDVDETPLHNESAQQTSWRLSRNKAEAVGIQHTDAIIIGSDQVALLGDNLLGKPVTHENAVQQLMEMRGRTVIFYTALSVFNSRTKKLKTEIVTNRVNYRKYTDSEIENYLKAEQPYDCAGSVKSEGLGIALIHSIEGEDPNALVGLPLISLVGMLTEHGVSIL